MTERAREESERDWGTHTYISRGLHYIRGANNFALISIPICVPLHIVFIYICPRSLLLLYISFIFYYIFSMHITQDIYIEEEKREEEEMAPTSRHIMSRYFLWWSGSKHMSSKLCINRIHLIPQHFYIYCVPTCSVT